MLRWVPQREINLSCPRNPGNRPGGSAGCDSSCGGNGLSNVDFLLFGLAMTVLAIGNELTFRRHSRVKGNHYPVYMRILAWSAAAIGFALAILK
jgi:hypothetical protein